jgi:hypothetical protein
LELLAEDFVVRFFIELSFYELQELWSPLKISEVYSASRIFDGLTYVTLAARFVSGQVPDLNSSVERISPALDDTPMIPRHRPVVN